MCYVVKMILKVQKRLAAQILNCSPKRIAFDPDRLGDIKQAITNRDLKLLIGEKAIIKKPMNATSKFRARKIRVQKSKGRRKGPGSHKGSHNARVNIKDQWMTRLRVQRAFLRELVDKGVILRKAYRELYLKSKGGYFRSKRHIKLFLEEHDEMIAKKQALKSVIKPESESKSVKKRILKEKVAENEEEN